MEDLAKLYPAILHLGGETAMRGVVDAMNEVCGQWKCAGDRETGDLDRSGMTVTINLSDRANFITNNSVGAGLATEIAPRSPPRALESATEITPRFPRRVFRSRQDKGRREGNL